MFKKYSHSNTATEALSIFLYSKLVVNKINSDELSIEDYSKFEITDKDISNYNSWIEQGCPEFDLITIWLEKFKEVVEYFNSNFNTIFKPKVELWSDRHKTDYYKEQLQKSFDFENHIAIILKENYGLELEQYLTPQGQYELGENKLGIEIKHDMMYKKTGNLYIEYQEKSNANNVDWINSGILKKDNCKYFLIGDFDKFWIFNKNRLVEIFNEENNRVGNSKRGIRFVQNATSKGFIFNIKHAEKEIIELDMLVKEIKEKMKDLNG